ncbi:bifunctional diaminohydroxyphosphoribosylaminopyrimidine deaminase/5-amino-6-(5-phosphoribosylamino)uracil reductase RibD [Kordiimonas sp. SCSIO 12610]|nr:bifunctional diaminohydroxyphosphoribosylaminopyrimidine deaminase/5-amino-6-(5-phosphoribosylamino)uracil reductase RibD [Kordiimonas sp. SCSIO 12610]
MRDAISLAKRGLGTTHPNPSVGCVIVKNDVIVGRGFTQPGGRPHAEVVALSQAGDAARDSDVYVTLEPCAHTGKTPPCAEALIEAKVKRVYIAILDKDERVRGKGVDLLEAAGIEVLVGVCEDEARKVNKGFLLRFEEARPLYTSKIASSLDGRIALASGESKWITGPKARTFGHMLRAKHDAILVGVNTVLKDNPSLTCRLPGLENRSPIRVVLDRNLRTPIEAKTVSTAKIVPTYIVTEQVEGDKLDALLEVGVNILSVANIRDIEQISKELVKLGLTRVLIEGGGVVHASFLNVGIVDRIEHFIAGKAIGGDGLPAIGKMDVSTLKGAPRYQSAAIRQLGPDILASWDKEE